MSHDHVLRLSLSWTFFVLGLIVLSSAFVPAQWPSKNILLASGCLALAVSAVLDRSKFTATFMTRAPSGRVKALKGFFAFVGLAAVVPAIVGLGLLFQQEPLGNGPNSYPGSVLALFSLHPLACAYLTLAASGRSIIRRGRQVGP